MDAYELNGVEYIVVEAQAQTFGQAALELLADRTYGVGADRILLVDRIEGKLVSVVNSDYGVRVPTLGDYVVCKAFLTGECAEEIRYSELRLTDYFYQQLVTAGTISNSAAC